MVSLPSWPILQIGSSGSNVIAIQYILNGYKDGLFSVPVTGFFSPDMDTVVRKLQVSFGLQETGKIDEALYDEIATLTRAIPNPSVSYYTKAVQQLLNKFDSNLDVDGKFGPATADALVIFQMKMGFNISGVADLVTWRYLFGYERYPADAVMPSPPSTKAYATVEQVYSSLTPSQVRVNAAWVYNFLTNTQSCSGRSACAILGNMQMESGINPGMWEIMSYAERGYGLVQFTPASKFLEWAQNQGIIFLHANNDLPTSVNNLAVSDPEKLLSAEMDYLMVDVQSGFKPPEEVPFPELNIQTFNGFKRSDGTVAQLTEVFLTYYERPQNNSSLQERIDYAEAWAKYFGISAG